ncbi:MAG: sensor histidine kinase [Planctomycetota bacterium]|nr:MAG: sensor histidine kinase [Planctomycetota bacterium]
MPPHRGPVKVERPELAGSRRTGTRAAGMPCECRSGTVRWTIRKQIFVPFLTLSWLVVVLAMVAVTRVAMQRWEQHTVRQLQQALDAVREARYPLTENVLRQLRALTGAEFVLTDAVGRPVMGTLAVSPASRWLQQTVTGEPGLPATFTGFARRSLGGTEFFVAATRTRDGDGPRRLVVLYPVPRWEAMRRELAASAAGIAVFSGAVVLLVSWRLAGRMARRIGSLEAQVARLACGAFETIAIDGPADELRSLTTSVNHLAGELQRMQQAIAASERERLLHQWAGGLAHQLRNAITGARLALQVHQRRCDSGDRGLAVALQQMRLMEQQVRGLLALARHERPPERPGTVGEVVREVVESVRLHCEHTGVALRFCEPAEKLAAVAVRSRDALHSAVLNVVLNAVEAAGPGGNVLVDLAQEDGRVSIRVTDDGPGPPSELADRLGEPFVSGKPDGVGLGLAVAGYALEMLRGRLDWCRTDGRTSFRIQVPVDAAATVSETARESTPANLLNGATHDAAAATRGPLPAVDGAVVRSPGDACSGPDR